MINHQFKINDQVVYKNSCIAFNDIYSYSYVYTVISITDKFIIIEAASQAYIEKADPAEIMSLADAQDLIKKLEEEKNALEKQFNEYKIIIQAKLNEAALSLKAANDLAKKADKIVSKCNFDSRDLLSQINKLGWRSSTIECS